MQRASSYRTPLPGRAPSLLHQRLPSSAWSPPPSQAPRTPRAWQGKGTQRYKTLLRFPAPPHRPGGFTENLEARVALWFGKNHPRTVSRNAASEDRDVRMGQLFCFSFRSTRVLLPQAIKFFLRYFSCFQMRAAVARNSIRHSLMRLLEV